MTTRFWVIGGEYRDPAFQALIPGTEKMAGPFADEARARTEGQRLTCCPDRSPCATVRYSIAAERVN
jgi:hypothetical protein